MLSRLRRSFRFPWASFSIALQTACAMAPCAVSAAPVMLNSEGQYLDCFEDATGLSSKQNVKIGPSLVNGVRVSLGNWSWAQSYTKTGDVVVTPFNDPRAVFNLTQVNGAGPTAWSTVSLWSKTFNIVNELTLDPAATTTPAFAVWAGANTPLAFFPNLERFNDKRVIDGPKQAGLAANRLYTATLHALYCNSPDCKSGPDISGAAAGTFSVIYGATAPSGLTAVDLKLGSAGGTPPGNFAFTGEGIPSPYTLEWEVPFPLPPGSGWDYRFKVTLTTTGSPACTPGCSATLYVDAITVMAMGQPIQPLIYDDLACGPGTKPNPCVAPCTPTPTCILDTLPCGWDTASWYTDAGSYLSPVFDSLSDKTVWQQLWWSTDQGYSGPGAAGEGIGWPATPVGIKWRVGNSPDPSIWLGNPNYFTWTIPNSVTCTGERGANCVAGCQPPGGQCDCTSGNTRGAPFGLCPPRYPPPMDAVGSAPMYVNSSSPFLDGTSTPAVGRYFQYEVDFTSRYANGKYPVSQDGLQREFHANASGSLNAMRVYYLPARGEVISNLVKPSQLAHWRAVKYETEVSTGGTVEVDVLDQNNIPLFNKVPSGFSLAGLDPGAYPALKLRAHIDNGGINTVRPALLCWELDWDTFSEPLQLNRNSVNVGRNEVVKFTVVITSARPGTLTIHDAAGQVVRRFFEGVFPAGVQTYVWDGTNRNGERVTPGVYFVTLKAKEIRRTRTIAITR